MQAQFAIVNSHFAGVFRVQPLTQGLRETLVGVASHHDLSSEQSAPPTPLTTAESKIDSRWHWLEWLEDGGLVFAETLAWVEGETIFVPQDPFAPALITDLLPLKPTDAAQWREVESGGSARAGQPETPLLSPL